MREELRAACLVEGIELTEAIGSGGSSTVYGARWRDREVAVKVLEQECGRLPRLDHPFILGVLSQGSALGRPYLVLERYPSDLGRLLAGRPLRSDLLRPVLVPLLEAVDFAHRRGVLHGDLKPGNVLVDAQATPVRVALTDFGLTSLSPQALETSLLSRERDHQAMSTLAYMAPERLGGERPTAEADVYSLGVVLFEALTGRRPAGLELPSELQPRLGRRFDDLVKAALATLPASRPSVAGLRRELLRLLPKPIATRTSDEMAYIPAGSVVIGDRDDPDARPMHEVSLPSFWIDTTPVTNQAYQEFVRATGARAPKGWPRGPRLPRRLARLPVTGVSWDEANAYARWAGRRLPTEREWERAAQGPEHRPFPYGESFDPARIHTDPSRLASVGSYPQGASSEGVLDLTGNGWEWTSSPFAPYAAPEAQGVARTVRGGYDPAREHSGSATCRLGLRPDARDPGVTFRCALDA